jgi:7-cyano-7-deazaguanine synthase
MAEAIKPAVVLLSGGMDSTTLLHYVIRECGSHYVHALSFNYGQRHSRELDCARWQADAAKVASHRVIDITFFGDLVKQGTALVAGGYEVPDLDDVAPDQRDQPPTYVPNRNMMLLSMAAAFAEAHDIPDVYYGAQAQDEYGYWDCTATFIHRLNNVLALNRREAVTVRAPFAEMSKSAALRIGLALGVDYSHTWSCYRGDGLACGTCPTCVERLKAFDEAGIPDPLPYSGAAE